MKLIILDRDGVINRDSDQFIKSPEEWIPIPGSLEARENLAGIVKDYVDELAADPNAPDDVLMDVAVQNTRLSDLYGGLGVANFGDTETSFALLLKAEEALNRLLERSPDDVHAIDEIAWVKRLKANQEMSYQLDMDAARRTNEEGLALVERGITLPGADETKLFFRLWNSRTDRVKILMFMFTAFCACVFATCQVMEFGSAGADRGLLKEFEAIIAVVIGGALLTGGYGSVIGAALGALIFGVVQQGLFFANVESSLFRVFLGVILLFAVVLNTYIRRMITGER